MAAPSYTTDLATINLAQDTGTWSEMDDWGGGGTRYTDETDYYIQGGNCTSQIATKTGANSITSLIVDYGSDLAGSFTPGETCVFMWHVFLPANALDTFANGGTRLIVGADEAVFDAWKTGGNDFGRNPYGGWQNVAVDPSVTSDYQDDGAVGNGGVYRWFGGGVYLLAGIGKGAPHGVDAIRYGRGDLIVTQGDLGNGYATFVGMAAENDDPNLRWGLFQAQAGSYLWKGLMSLGTATTAVDFRDSNRNITIDDTPRAYSDFNKIEINHNDSNIEWIGINITAVNAIGLSIGDFEVFDDPTILIDTCVFTDMNIFVFGSTATDAVVQQTTFRRCGQVTQGNTSFDGCIFDESVAAVSLLASDIDLIDDCDFYSDGSNHSIELDENHAGGSYTLSGCTWTDYAVSDGDTGNECIFNDSTGHVNVSVGAGQLPTVRNGLGATTTVSASVPIYIIVKDTDGDPIQDVQTAIYKISDRTQIVNQDTDIDGEVDTSYTESTPESVEVRCRKASAGATKYKNYSSLQTIATTTGLSLSVTMIEDPNNNATT
jgi:hypothetical protein